MRIVFEKFHTSTCFGIWIWWEKSLKGAAIAFYHWEITINF